MRHRLLRKLLGLPPELQLSDEAARELKVLLLDAGAACLDALKQENEDRWKWSKPLRRLLPRHIEAAREKLGITSRPEPQEPSGEQGA